MFRGVVSFTLLSFNTLFWGVPLLLVTLLKLVLPFEGARRRLLVLLNRIAGAWIATNNLWIRHWLKPDWRIRLPEGLSPRGHWLVIANHRSWVDAFALLYALHGRIAPPRFFVKRELVWLPVVGQAAWALEFPIMRRYSAHHLRRHPHLAHRDMRNAARLLARARHVPMSIYNFAEGTRLTRARHLHQQSPHAHLLRPRAGGCAQVVALLGEQLCGIVDVTLDYRHTRIGFGDFLCGRSGSVTILARRLDVPPWMIGGDYLGDHAYRERFQAWINALWQEKDQQLSPTPDS